MYEKIKILLTCNPKGKWVIRILIILLAFTSIFILGRLSKKPVNPGIIVEYPEINFNKNYEKNNKEGKNGNYFASSKGKKYYPLGCSAGKSLKLENRIYFTTEEEAKRAGYEISSSCK